MVHPQTYEHASLPCRHRMHYLHLTACTRTQALPESFLLPFQLSVYFFLARKVKAVIFVTSNILNPITNWTCPTLDYHCPYLLTHMFTVLDEQDFGVSDYSALISTVNALGRCVRREGVHISIGYMFMKITMILKPCDKPYEDERDPRNWYLVCAHARAGSSVSNCFKYVFEMEKGYTDIKWVADLLNAPTRRRYACINTFTKCPQ